jgi:hypothetical protein
MANVGRRPYVGNFSLPAGTGRVWQSYKQNDSMAPAYSIIFPAEVVPTSDFPSFILIPTMEEEKRITPEEGLQNLFLH